MVCIDSLPSGVHLTSPNCAGRHLALQLSLILFAIGAAFSTGAQNMAMMLAGRAISGIGAAGLLSVGLAVTFFLSTV